MKVSSFKLLFVLFFGIILFSCNEEKKAYKYSFFNDVDKVVYLSYDDRSRWGDDLNLEIVNNIINIPKLEIKKKLVIENNKFEDLFELLSKDNEEDCSMNKCYEPRDILLFYKKDKLNGFYEFCKECGGNKASKNLDSLPSFCVEKGRLIDGILN